MRTENIGGKLANTGPVGSEKVSRRAPCGSGAGEPLRHTPSGSALALLGSAKRVCADASAVWPQSGIYDFKGVAPMAAVAAARAVD